MKKMIVGGWKYLVVTLGLVLSLGVAAGQEPAKPEPPKEDYVKAHYTKYEYRIPMRGGKRLFTSGVRPQGPLPVAQINPHVECRSVILQSCLTRMRSRMSNAVGVSCRAAYGSCTDESPAADSGAYQG